MRGDSLRDFYAKTFAVIGLGFLAGAGAMVDYWPVSSPMPTVSSPALPQPGIQTLVQRLDQRIPAPRFQQPLVVRGTIHAKNVGSARFLPATPEAPVTAAPMMPAVEPAAELPVPDVNLPVAESPWTTLLATPEPVVALKFAPAPSDPQPGLISGALRKTKDGIVKTGAVTGATIADAVRGVVGAFKKITPL